MAKPILKWTETDPGWLKAGPLEITFGVDDWPWKVGIGDIELSMHRTLAEAKRACERLAHKIIAATKGKRHGK